MKKTFLLAIFMLSCIVCYGEKAEAAVTAGLSGTTLTVSGTGTFEGVDSSQKATITTIIVKEGVTEIADGAFSHCTSLRNVTLPDSLQKMGDCIFFDCTKLTKITIPKNVTVAFHAFKESNIQEITFAEGMKIIPEGICENASSLTTVHLPSTTTEIGAWAFSKCTSLSDVTLPDNLQKIGSNAFFGCTSLTKIAIPKNVTYTSSCFEKSGLQEITFAEGMKKIPNYICYNASNLTTIHFPSTITEIGVMAFESCNLSSVTLPDGLQKIGCAAFSGCSNLTKITIPKSVTEVEEGGCFSRSGLRQINFQMGMKKIPDYICHNASNLTLIHFPNTITEIGTASFRMCTSLISVTLPENLQKIGKHAFSDCTSLTGITIPEKVTEIGNYAFDGCTGLATVDFSSGLQTIGIAAFRNTTLKYAVIPATVTKISLYAFDKDVEIKGGYDSVAHKYASQNGNPFAQLYKEMKYLTISPIKAQKHTGKALKPSFVVRDGNNILVSGIDYKVTYSNNIKPGTATITITGCRSYYIGSTTITFKIAPSKGNTFTVGKLKYTITNDSTNKKGTVSVKGLAKNTKSVTIPKTVKICSFTYKVTAIQKKAFYKKSKLKKITISSKTITKMGSKAFTGIDKNATFKVPKSKKTTYKKMLYKAGVKKNMKIK